MSNIKTWFDIISNNEIHACNRVSSRDLSICINFIQIPDTNTIVMTLAVMKNKIKKNSLDPQSFARLMRVVEESLDETYWKCDRKSLEEEHLQNVKSQLSNQWYIKLCCHRVFFIPETELFEVVKNLFNQEQVSQIKAIGIDEVAVYANTDSYDFNAKFY